MALIVGELALMMIAPGFDVGQDFQLSGFEFKSVSFEAVFEGAG